MIIFCKTALELDSLNVRFSRRANLSIVWYTILILLLPASTSTILATAFDVSPIIFSPTIAFWKIGSVDVNANLSNIGAFASYDS